MSSKKLCFILLVAISASSAFAQKSIKEIVRSSKNLESIQKQAKAYFEAKHCDDLSCIGYDSEYHKYRRWEWFWKSRLDKDGNKPNLVQAAKNINKWNLQKSNGLFEDPFYDWKNITQTSSLSGYVGMGRAAAMGFHPTDENTFYIGAPNGGIWKTTDGGINYTELGDDLPFVSVGNILVNHENPSELYISVGDHLGLWSYGIGVYKSIDGGLTWNPTNFAHNLEDNIAIIDMAMSPADPNIILVATADGLFHSKDGLETSRNARSGEISSVEFDKQDPTVAFCTVRKDRNSTFYRSTTSGSTWVRSRDINGSRDWTEYQLAQSPSDPNIVYIVGNDLTCFQSTDNGINFTQQANIPQYGPVVVSGTNPQTLYTGFTEVYESNNGGNYWSQKTLWHAGSRFPTVHADQRRIYNNPHDNTKIYFCNDGGVYVFTPLANNWKDISDGLIIMQYYAIANAQTHDNILIGGTQDNGGRYRAANGNWRATNGGDGMEVAINPTNHNTIYTTYINGYLYRSYDAWTNDVGYCISCNIPGKENEGGGRWVTPYVLDPNDPKTIVAGYERVWKSTNEGHNWQAISGELRNGDDMDAIAVAPSDSDYIYTSSLKFFYGTSNGGLDWHESKMTPTGTITSIAVHPQNESQVWISFSSYSDGDKCFYSTDGGLTWENQSYNLPNVPCNNVAYVTTVEGDVLMMGTDIGLFVKPIDSDVWSRYGTNLPNTIVTDIEVQYSSDKVRIATYGRGVWEAPLGSLTSSTNNIHEANSFIFPNPVAQKLNIRTSLSFEHLEVFDLSGKRVISSSTENDVDVSSLKSGIYFLKLTGDKESITKKFVKE